MAQHPNLPNQGFPTSTIFTLGTDNGIILIRVHTEADDLHLFTTFVRRDDFTVRLHWTNWEPGQEETVINHNGIDVPVDSEEPIISASIRYQRYYHTGPPFHFQPPTETHTEPESPGHPPLYTTNPDAPSEEPSPLNPTASTTGLYPGSEQHADTETEPEEMDEDSDTTSQYTDARLLHRDVLLAIAKAENTEP